MGKKSFTPEEIKILRQNIYTLKISETHLWFTPEFKEIFHEEYSKGKSARQILQELGYDPVMLGQRRVWDIPMHIREQFIKYGGFRGPKTAGERIRNRPADMAAKLRKMEHEVKLLRQEVEFLKKIGSAKKTQK